MFESIKDGVSFYRDPIAFLSNCQRDHGDYHVARLGRKTVHLVFDPNLARSILNDPLTFKKTSYVYNKIKPITGATGLVQVEGEEGLKLRRSFNQFFSQKAIDGYLAAAREVVETTAPQFEGEHDVRDIATEMVLGTALSMFTGAGPATETEQLSHCFLRLNDLCAKEFKNLLPLGNPIRKLQIKQAQRELDDSIVKVMDGGNEECLIQRLRAAEAEIPMELTDQFLLNQVKTFLFAGHETTATYLIMALYELAKDPQLQDRIYQDCANGVGVKPGSATSAFLREILRLYSPAWMIVREATTSGNVNGREFRGGDYIFIGVHQIHRHQEHWSDPEKLSLDHHDEKNVAFMPYGAGKRHCIGSRLADLELEMILEVLLGRYRLKLVGEAKPIQPKVMITAYPGDPVNIAFSKR